MEKTNHSSIHKSQASPVYLPEISLPRNLFSFVNNDSAFLLNLFNEKKLYYEAIMWQTHDI